MKPEITCPKCSFEFALDQALNREMELDLRRTISAELERKHDQELKRLHQEAIEQAARTLTEFKVTIAAQAKQLREAREHELTLLRAKAELQEQAEKAELEARRKLESLAHMIRAIGRSSRPHPSRPSLASCELSSHPRHLIVHEFVVV